MTAYIQYMRDGFPLSVLEFPVEDPDCLFQICHGAWEHKERYTPFAEFLQSQNIAVVIADQRGHGKSVTADHPKEYMKDYNEMVEDQWEVSTKFKEKYPGKKLFLFGHSMGSMIARLYLREHDNEIKGLILTGTANPNPAGAFGARLCGLISLFSGGKHGHSRIIASLSGLDSDLSKWLSYSQDNIKRNIEDKEELTRFDNKGFATLYAMSTAMRWTDDFHVSNPLLPILSANGKDDPVTGFEKGLEDSRRFLEKAGYSNLTFITYNNMMHEVLNEDDHDIVYKDILDFIHSNL
ncbi:MAG: alpha/beta fold hydrolase [Solobacterium sp.]|nr:alpha/beta fold hydrolase [Solobacterium sp.]MBR2727791.1 alpha/beta fold hydrolase [Solobacterium sp.]